MKGGVAITIHICLAPRLYWCLNKYDLHTMSLRHGFLYLTALKYMFNCARRPVYGEPAAIYDPIATWLYNSIMRGCGRTFRVASQSVMLESVSRLVRLEMVTLASHLLIHYWYSISQGLRTRLRTSCKGEFGIVTYITYHHCPC